MGQDPIATMIPAVRTELAELVAFRSVADLDVSPRSESERAAEWIAATLRAEEFDDVTVLDMPDGRQSVYGSCPARRTRRPSCSTRTSTSSPRSTRPRGPARPSP